MRWSWKLCTIAGIGIFMHGTFLLLLAWVLLSHLFQGAGLAVALQGVGFILALFGCVVLHELGHSLAARRYGIATRDITLLPIGGVARLTRMPEEPYQELVVAIAGPAVNAGLAILFFVLIQVVDERAALNDVALVGGDFLAKLLWVNVSLVIFNLLPAFPMDGGRVLRAVLAQRLPYARATQIAASVGQALALGLGFLGLFFNPVLVFVALFVFMGAAEEAGMAQVRSTFHGIPVRSVMISSFNALDVNDPVQRAIEHILRGSQEDFPVLDNDRVAGVLTRHDLVTWLSEHGVEGTIGEAVRRETEPVTAEADEMLDTVYQRMREAGVQTIPVLRRGALVGILTTENVGEFAMIQAALRRERS